MTVKCVPCARLALHRDRAAVQLHQFLHQRQADAAALVGAAARAFDAVETLEQTAAAPSPGMPVPVSRTVSFDASPSVAQRHVDLTLEGELEGVGEQVEDDLLPHVAVDIDRLGQRRAVDDEPQPGPLDGRAEDARQFGGQGRQIGRLVSRLDAAGLDAREIQQRVDQLQQAQPVAVGDLQPLALRRRQLVVLRPERLRAAPASASAACGTRG